MAKPAKQEASKANSTNENNKKNKSKTLEVPHLVDMTITFARSAFLLVSMLVALISYGAGSDLQTIFVRTMIAMIVAGLVMWLISWWVTEQVLEGQSTAGGAGGNLQEDPFLKDVRA